MQNATRFFDKINFARNIYWCKYLSIAKRSLHVVKICKSIVAVLSGNCLCKRKIKKFNGNTSCLRLLIKFLAFNQQFQYLLEKF